MKSPVVRILLAVLFLPVIRLVNDIFSSCVSYFLLTLSSKQIFFEKEWDLW